MTMKADCPSFGLYVHIPFCLKKCAYCDFFSQTDYSIANAYLQALLTEASMVSEQYRERTIDTVYIGGGTPSSLSASQLAVLLGGLRERFHINADAEFTLEANPATLDEEKLGVLRSNGVNRLSLGLQSASNTELCTLSRIHSYEDFEKTYSLARQYIDNISLDLMFGLPDQTEGSFRDTLNRAVSLKPNHISMYALKIEEGTPFHRMGEKLSLPSEDEVANMYLYACDFLEKAGFQQYEISNFARQGCLSRHNLRYWKRKEYIGIGPAAHSFIGGRRYANQKDLAAYIQALSRWEIPPRSEEITLSLQDEIEEEIMLKLRTTAGLDMVYLKEKFGYAIEKTAASKIREYVKHGFLTHKGNTIAFTPRGFLVSNTVIADLLPDE
ncbi:MAG: radical SAM family heme chaperone HemW [Clostridia bacterium]|nr:radical SAM family heme chaperone HemW [Clostridia bacterium]